MEPIGYVKLHRKIKIKGWYRNSKYIHLWVHLLLKANHQIQEFMWNNQIIIIKAGQFITGRKQLSEETGIAQSTIEKILNLFEKEHQIEQQKTTKYRLITIVNWDKHQKDNSKRDNNADNKGTTKEQQRNTNKNDKNDKNDKNIDTTALKQKFFSNSLMEEIKKQYPNRNYEFQFGIMCDWWLANKKKLPQHISAFSNWLKNTKPELKEDLSKYDKFN